MPDHDTKFSLNRHAKRRRVDIGVKRTVSSAATLTQTASGIITAKPTIMNGIRKQDVLESQAARLGHMDMGATRSNNVLRKLLKRTSSYGDGMVPFHSAAIISNLLKRNMSKGGGDQGITESKASQEDTCSTSSQDSPQECPSPSAITTLCPFDSERLNDEHLRAKRARVENIIRGMSHSPFMTAPSIPHGTDRGRYEDGETEGPPQSGSPRDNYRENKRKQKLPQQQHRSYQQLVSAHKEQKVEERRQLKLQLEDMQKQLRQLQEKLFQMYDSTDSEADGGNISEDSVRSDEGLIDGDLNEDSRSDNDLDPGQFLDQARALLGEQVLSVGEKPKRESSLSGKDLISMHEEGKHLAETLKQELNSAMSQVVETVVKIFEKSRRTTQDYIAGIEDNPDFHTPHQRVQCLADVINPGPRESFGGAPLPSANHQTEALSLVVRKSPFEHHRSSALGADGGHPHPSLHPSSLSANMTFSSPSFRHPFPLSLMAYSFQSAFGAPSAGYNRKDQNFPDSMDLSRESIGMPTKMSSSHHLGHHRSCSPVHPGSTAEGPSLSFIKSECGDLQDMSDISTYSGSTVQEGLSPNHLKKAKVMFFFARYPSSNTLKMFFPDVKFNRCITSQLIKWFSNFREFFYIQMEKFARQAVNDGVLTADDLSVTCDSELYRVLNMHYNKSNDFQVPERFLEVAQITLREFFNAIVSGKDVDPSWKKAIYKVICKLDSEVPEIFKSKNCLLKLLHE